jgi:hypothetical protein
VSVDDSSHFVINDLKTGAGERARYHYRETGCDVYSRAIWVLERADRTKEMDVAAFFAAIQEPPLARRFAASTLKQRERESLGTNVTILKLEKRSKGGYSYRRSDEDMVWRDAGKAGAFDPAQTYYYVPLSGYQMQSSKGYGSGKELYDDVASLPGLFNGTIYGVRKSDIEEVRKMKNWVNFEEHITATLATKDVFKLLMSLVKNNLDRREVFDLPKDVMYLVDQNSPLIKMILSFKGVDKFTGNQYNMNNLFRKFAPNANLSPEALTVKYQKELNDVNSRYPLLSKLNTYRVEASDIAEYVNLIDAKKGI